MSIVLHPELVDEIDRGGDFNATECMNCGVCTAVCPLGIDALPRRLFHQVTLGMRDALLEQAETVYSCLLCGACEVNCPAGVHIAENVRGLRHYLNHTLYRL
ncbi:MAG TPA: 4Fe-4S dicluster domain-containing protein [Pseudonocardiaceae bacterium]